MERSHQHVYVQYGAGLCAPEGWLNFDASLTNRVEKLPLVGKLAKKNARRFPDGVSYGDVVKGLPLPSGCARGVYASHVLEHLQFDDVFVALRETLRILESGGTFRLIVPDLLGRAQRYIEESRKGNAKASIEFLKSCDFRETEAAGRRSLIYGMLRTSGHLWMWDEGSMTWALESVGFTAIRRCQYGDAADPMFRSVENPGRFVDQELQIPECALEARKG